MAKLILLYICARISIAERRQINEKKAYRKSTELMVPLCPPISPTDVPVSAAITWPNLSRPSPTTTMRWLSGDQARSLMVPINGYNNNSNR